MSPQAVIHALSPLVGELTAASTDTYGVMLELNKARQVVQAALQGGQPGPLVAEITTIIRTLGQANMRLKAAKESTEEKIAEARRTGTLVSGSLPSELSPSQEVAARTGVPEPAPSERPGERVAKEEPDDLSGLENYRRKAVRKASTISDGARRGHDFLQQGIRLRPTGQQIGAPPGPAVGQNSVPAPIGDLLTGAIAAGAMIGELARFIIRQSRQQRKDHDADQ